MQSENAGTGPTRTPTQMTVPTGRIDPAAMFDLDQRVVIVTGASSGLGDRFARVAHAAGATVVVAARRVDRLERLAEDLGDRVLVVGADLTRAEERERLVDAALGIDGVVDVLVNNAGHSEPMAALDTSLEHFGQNLELNLVAPFHLSQLVAAPMLERGSGSIVNVASILGMVASAPMKEAAYCASKGGLVNLTRQLGAEWGRKGVRVNAIAPGWFRSEMTQADMFDDEGGAAFIARNAPMGRPGDVHELDGAFLFLASDASTYVTGHILAVDGGWVAR